MSTEIEDRLVVYLVQCWKWRISRTRPDLKLDISYYFRITGLENKFSDGQPS